MKYLWVKSISDIRQNLKYVIKLPKDFFKEMNKIEQFSMGYLSLLYVLQGHSCRSEDVGLARELDYKAAAAWVGHPYFDVIDNSTDFETKIKRMISSVCQKVGIDTGDRLLTTSKKVKFHGELSRFFETDAAPLISQTRQRRI